MIKQEKVKNKYLILIDLSLPRIIKKTYLIVCQNRIREFQFYGNDLATIQIH